MRRSSASSTARRSSSSRRAASTGSPTTRSSCLAQIERRGRTARSTGTCSASSSDDRTGSTTSCAVGAARCELGGRVVALTMPVAMDMNMNFLTFSVLWLHPRLARRARRRRAGADPPSAGPGDPRPAAGERADLAVRPPRRTSPTTSWATCSHAENEPYRNRVVGEVAAERGQDAFATWSTSPPPMSSQTIFWPRTDRRRRRRLEAPRRGLGAPRRDARWLRRRCPSGPHARRAVSHPVPRRHAARAPAHLARARRAPDDRRPRPPLRAPRSRSPRGRLPGRRRDLRPRASAPAPPTDVRPSRREQAPGCGPDRCRTRARERPRGAWSTARPREISRASCCAAAATPRTRPAESVESVRYCSMPKRCSPKRSMAFPRARR